MLSRRRVVKGRSRVKEFYMRKLKMSEYASAWIYCANRFFVLFFIYTYTTHKENLFCRLAQHNVAFHSRDIYPYRYRRFPYHFHPFLMWFRGDFRHSTWLEAVKDCCWLPTKERWRKFYSDHQVKQLSFQADETMQLQLLWLITRTPFLDPSLIFFLVLSSIVVKVNTYVHKFTINL